MDATVRSTGEMVALKRIRLNLHPYEREISEYFSTDVLAADPRNHCIPVYEVLEVPDDADMIILVMPFMRLWDLTPKFMTIGEVIDFLTQIFEAGVHAHDSYFVNCI